ncbi:MAG: hypothetical protein ACRCZI_12080 [Cetobacterium sp.]
MESMNTLLQFPLLFYDSEFDKRLGLYQKWIHGDPNQIVPKIYSMSAFQTYFHNTGFIIADYQKYAEYLYLTTNTIIDNFPEWVVRIYIDESILHPDNTDNPIWKNKLLMLMTAANTAQRLQIIAVKFPHYYTRANCHKELLAVMFRYLALFDKNTSIILFRDIDNIYTEQHEYFTNYWISQNVEICLFMNENYKRQEIQGLSPTEIILKEEFQTTILSGIWNIRKPIGYTYPPTIWQKIFAYIEDSTNCTYKEEYLGYTHYGQRFTYGFDELALTKVAIPIFISMGLRLYSIPIRIYDVEYFKNMFENPLLAKFIKNLAEPKVLEFVKKTMIDNYWNMYNAQSGLSQYILCIITNIYFGIIQKKSRFYNNETFINNIKNKIIPNTLLMALGNFVFKNFKKYNWHPLPDKSKCGSLVVKTFLETNQKISISDWSAGTYMISVNGEIVLTPDIPDDGGGGDPPNDYNI